MTLTDSVRLSESPPQPDGFDLDAELELLTEQLSVAYEAGWNVFLKAWTPSPTLTASGFVEASVLAELATDEALNEYVEHLLAIFLAGAESYLAGAIGEPLLAAAQSPADKARVELRRAENARKAALRRAGLNPEALEKIANDLAALQRDLEARARRDAAARWTEVRKLVAQGIRDETSLADLRAQMADLVDSDWRAARNAQTALTNAFNSGRQAAAVAAGDSTHKMWMAVMDSRTRHDHVAADGQIVFIGTSFSVGGSLMPFPGDGPIEQVVNCRCWVEYSAPEPEDGAGFQPALGTDFLALLEAESNFESAAATAASEAADAEWEATNGNPRPSGEGDCYPSAWQDLMSSTGDAVEHLLVHAVVVGQGALDDVRFDHAWVERAHPSGSENMWMVVDNSNGNSVELPRDFYYQLGRIDKDQLRRYTLAEAAELSLDFGTYGPWV